MKAYVGQTRSAKLMATLDGLGISELTQRGERPRRNPFAQDNLAYADHKAGRLFDGAAFWKTCLALEASGRQPDFLVVPDIVAGGLDSLRFSMSWLHSLLRFPWPLYLPVQDGMSETDVAEALTPRIAGIFVGGSTEWKEETGAAWVKFAHARGLRCHIGRVGTARKVRWALTTGCDSIDSSLPLFSTNNLRIFVEALGMSLPPVPVSSPLVQPDLNCLCSSFGPCAAHYVAPSRKWIHLATGQECAALGGFSIVYADPAWKYKNNGRGAAENHYRCMTIEEICALPVAQLAAPNAVLFLWGCYALTPEALLVMRAWGFTFKTLAFDWVKYTAKDKEHFGLGKWTRGNPEPCWLGVRGKWPRRVNAGVRQLVNTYEIEDIEPEVVAAKKREHSRKPVEVRQRIEKLMGDDHAAVELFAREQAPGWECWGDQVAQTVTLTDSL